MRIFYSYSNHNNMSLDHYEKLSKDLYEKYGKDIIIDVDTYNGRYEILEKITSHIDDCDLFMCDMTPDELKTDNINTNTKIENIKPNPNVMIELGYAISKKKEIIILKDNSYNSEQFKMCDIPSMIISRYNIYDLEIDYEEIIDMVCKKINDKYNRDTIVGSVFHTIGDKFLKNKNPELEKNIKSTLSTLFNA